MFNKLFKKQKVDSKSILPLDGSMSSTIFENKNTGTNRSLFYSLSIPFLK
jgi:hypothetical protein